MDSKEDDGNISLVEFYQKNLSSFKKVLLSLIKPVILENIAILLHSTIRSFEWQQYVEDMGIKDNFQILKIESKSKLWKEEPIFTALRCALHHNKSFGDVIHVLLERKRWDVLRHVKPYSESLLINISQDKSELISAEQHNRNVQNFTTQSSCYDVSGGCCSSDASYSVERDICFKFQENGKREKKLMNGNQVDESIVFGDKHKVCKREIVGLPKDTSDATQHELNTSSGLSLPPPYDNDSITVFIAHAEVDFNFAQSLADALQAESFIVRLYSEMDYLSFMDPTGSIRAILWEVDFIVPVVSQNYLEQVHPKRNAGFSDSTTEVDNRYLYQLLQNEYRINRCLNFRVRPVILPNMDRRLLMHDLLLSCALRLPGEVPKLIKVLKQTKQKIPRFF